MGRGRRKYYVKEQCREQEQIQKALKFEPYKIKVTVLSLRKRVDPSETANVLGYITDTIPHLIIEE